MTDRRGSTILMALMLSTLLLLVGLGFLGQREGQYRAAQEHLYYIQAKALADAGLQDALGKLAKDIDFPPIRSSDQSVFGYAEPFLDEDGALLGSYRVSIDALYRDRPFGVLRIRSVGILGAPSGPRATAVRWLEVDVARQRREINGPPNPDVFRTHFVLTND